MTQWLNNLKMTCVPVRGWPWTQFALLGMLPQWPWERELEKIGFWGLFFS